MVKREGGLTPKTGLTRKMACPQVRWGRIRWDLRAPFSQKSANITTQLSTIKKKFASKFNFSIQSNLQTNRKTLEKDGARYIGDEFWVHSFIAECGKVPREGLFAPSHLEDPRVLDCRRIDHCQDPSGTDPSSLNPRNFCYVFDHAIQRSKLWRGRISFTMLDYICSIFSETNLLRFEFGKQVWV